MKYLLLVISMLLLVFGCTSKNSNFGEPKVFGGAKYDSLRDVVKTDSERYIAAGMTTSFGNGSVDCYVVSFDKHGKKLWQKTYGSSADDRIVSITGNDAQGYVLAGYTADEKGDKDVLVIKVDKNGEQQWLKKYGDLGQEEAFDIEQCKDGGYIVTGYSNSFASGKETSVYVIKIDKDGNEQWSKLYGGDKVAIGSSIKNTSDNGYIIAGKENSFGAGMHDFYAIKIDSDGNCRWSSTYGTAGFDAASDIMQTKDGGYIMTGERGSIENKSTSDIYVVKTDGNGNTQWDKNIGWLRVDRGINIISAADGGYVIGGLTESYGNGSSDMYIVKIDDDGNTLWANTFGGRKDEYLGGIVDAGDGYIAAGWTGTFGEGEYDGYVVKMGYDGRVSE